MSKSPSLEPIEAIENALIQTVSPPRKRIRPT